MRRTSIPANADPNNILQDLHIRMTNFPLVFRERVCKECGWSIPTFYRKMRSAYKANKAGDKITSAISNAEHDKIIAVSDSMLQAHWIYCDKYRIKDSSL